MNARLIRIGNSRGIRIPREVLTRAGLSDGVILEVVDGGLLVRPRPTAGDLPHLTPARNPGAIPPSAPEYANGRLAEELASDREDR